MNQTKSFFEVNHMDAYKVTKTINIVYNVQIFQKKAPPVFLHLTYCKKI